jgi:hypothetical protein
VAVGATHASGCTVGERPSNENSGMSGSLGSAGSASARAPPGR